MEAAFTIQNIFSPGMIDKAHHRALCSFPARGVRNKLPLLFICIFFLIRPGIKAQGQGPCQISLLFDNFNPAVYLPASNQYYTGANGGYTWECWFRLLQPFGANIRPLISAVDGVTYEDLYLGFGWQGGMFNVPVTSLVFKVDGPGMVAPSGPSCTYAPPLGFSLNTWYHVAGVMNYNTQLAALYVNGVAVDTETITTPPITRLIPTELSYNYANTPLPMYGNMDEIRIWSRPLTAAEVFANYNQCLTGNEPNLLVYYNCNQPGGNWVDDATANNNNGIFAITPNFQVANAPVSGTACSIPSSTVTLTASDTLICPGQNVTLTAIGIPGWSYTWTPNIMSTPFYTAVVNPSSTTTYSALASAGWCNPAFDTITIYVTPNIIAVPADPVICAGETTTLTASGAATYTWSTGANTNSIAVSPTVSTIYTVSGTSTTNCVSQVTIMVSVSPAATVSASSSDPVICSGTNATLQATGATTYTWSTGSTNSMVVVNPLVNTTYSVYGGPCSIAPGVVSVSVNPTPTITAFAISTVICSGQSVTLMASGAANYTWSSGQNTNSITVSPPATITFTVYGSTSTCSSMAVVTASVAPGPTVSASGATVCFGGSATINASGGDTYSWTGPQGFTANTPSASIPSVSGASAGIYTVNVGLNGLCSKTATVEVLGFPYILPVASISATPKACLNSMVELQGSGGVSYLWTGPSNFSSTSQTVSFIAGMANAGIYTLSVKNSSNCAGSGTVLVNVLPLPSALLTAGSNHTCVPLCTSFFLSALPGSSPIESAVYSSTGLFQADSTVSHCFEQAGLYPVSARYTDSNGCSNTSTMIITAYQKPVADFEYLPLEPIEGLEPVHFINASTGQLPLHYNWFFTDNGGGGSQAENTSYLYEKAGAYPVALVATNSWGCSDTLVKIVKVENDFSIYVPNAFTPNGDLKNGIFQPKGIGIGSYQLEIFDRWGELLFTSNEFLKGWDGTYKGRPCKMDTYIWKITLKDPAGKIRNYSGHVTLLN
jgi:gliding motility-associated-like protein